MRKVAILTLLAAMALPARAPASDSAPILWMAASNSEPRFTGRSWGRLTVQDGEMRFHSNDYHWQVALSDIKRVDQSKAAPRALEVETFAGVTHFIAILDAKMMADSPRKAIQMIQRSMREASERPRPTLLTKGSR
jgi:hypothetical protein